LPEPYLTVSPGDHACLNKAITMKGYGAKYYSWEGPGKFKAQGQTLNFTAVSNSYSGTYTLTATDDKGCTNFTTTSLILDPLPQGSLKGSLMEACVPFRSDFSYFSQQPSGQIKTSWQIDNGPFIEGRTFSHMFKDARDYTIKGFFMDTTNTCMNTFTFVVHARPIPAADFTFTPEKPVEGLDNVFFVNTSNGVEQNKWNWHFINNEGYTSTQENCSYFFMNAGVYPVAMVVSNKWGCSDTVVKAVNIEPDFNVYVPNVFTPNGDSNNEAFKPVMTGVKFYELMIFDRWGKKLFQTSDQSLGWDGTYGGEPCKDDVYVWKIKVSSYSGEMKEMDGHVTIYR
jgi:gliding motility-associated-like protein